MKKLEKKQEFKIEEKIGLQEKNLSKVTTVFGDIIKENRKFLASLTLLFSTLISSSGEINAYQNRLDLRDEVSGRLEKIDKTLPTENLTPALLEKKAATNPDVLHSLKGYASANQIQKGSEPLKKKTIEKVVDEYCMYRERWETVLPEYNPTDYVIDSVVFEIQSELDSLLGEDVNGLDYAMTMSVLETSALPVLQGKVSYNLGIQEAQKAWQNYQQTKSLKALQIYRKSLNSILDQAIDGHGYVGTYRFSYATVIDVAQALGFEIKEGKEGAGIINEKQNRPLVKNVQVLKIKVRKKIEEGIRKGLSEDAVLASLADLDIRFDNQIMTLMTQTVPVLAGRMVEEKYPKKLSEQELKILLPLVHKMGMYAFDDLVRDYILAKKKCGVSVEKFLKNESRSVANYALKARGLLSLSALDKEPNLDSARL